MSRVALMANSKAYADLNNNLNRLVEAEEIKEGSQSGIKSIDSASKTSGLNVAGAFTLKLLGKGIHSTNKRIKLQKMALTGDALSTMMLATAPIGMDNGDSILGGMYRDNNEEEGLVSSAVGCTQGVGPPNTSIRLSLGMNLGNLLVVIILDADDNILNIGIVNGGGKESKGEEGEGGANMVVLSGGDSIGSEPSWEAPIQLAQQMSVKSLFRTTLTLPTASREDEREVATSTIPVSTVPGR
jgi:hypothetical protein